MKKIKYFINLVRIYFTYILRKKRCSYLPIRLWIETSSRCNLKCRLCVNKDIPPELKGDMDFNLYKKIVDEVKDYVFDINLFHRGEPLLNPKIVDMIKYANKRNIKTRIHTNGVLLTDELSHKLIKSGLNLISFSFDGYTKKTYEKNRVNAVYDNTLSNIINFLKIKSQLKSKTPFTIIQVMEFDEELSSKNLSDQKSNFIKKFDKLPLDKIIIRTPHNWGGLLELEGIKKINKEKSRLIPCTFPWYSLTIFYDGKVHLCPQDFEGEILLGNACKDSLKNIFNNEIMADVRNKFKMKDIEDMNPCSSCDRVWRETIAGIPREYLSIFLKDSFRKN
ncbi:MAG: radical SAM protein [Actinobacteria bacterium]|nr:radical SAM protein [Actinomycetota bacterium]MBL7060844.1 radical SAM protein [Actinomycetota bacterium]